MLTGNPVSHNITEAKVLDVYINKLLFKNKWNLTLSRKESLRGNFKKLPNILGSSSRLMATMVLEEVALKVLHTNEGDNSPITQFLHFLSKPHRLDTNKIRTTLINNKNKVKDTLQEQSDSLNNTNNQYGTYYKGEFSTNFNAKQS